MRYDVRLILIAVALAARLTLANDPTATTQPARRTLRVAIYHDAGSNDKGLENVSKCLNLDAVAGESAFQPFAITAEDIRAGKLKDVDVLVQPGGSGSKQATELQPKGCDAIQSFVKDGGGYVGICAGAYLASSDYKWSLGLLNAKVLDRAHWARGKGSVQIRLTDEGKKLLGVNEDVVPVEYAQGPLLAPDNEAELPAYTALATFETEIAEKGAPTGVMKGTTAIACGTFGSGRVICISPHPERSAGLDGAVRRAVEWVAGRDSK